ncbi:regulatory protein [Carbonactinospora thermoautotrophica]|uniref:Regulatory protein n=1 Tax=Carbonactinospora thermoautotrophica TaxID=1469144 RepID=A0A132MWF2_9ACTN|nr:PucR family transcriptional regulator [Carbonactinospora thermoautotrophica]KWX02163.1 regulatory protein [Carbonactinospora thermoautotrophica]
MPPTLGFLVSQPRLALRFADEENQREHAARPVERAWYTEDECTIPPARPGILVITTSQRGWAGDPDAADAYLRRMAALQVAGVALAVGARAPYQEVPRPLVEAAKRHGVPLLRLEYDAPWVLIDDVLREARAQEQRAELQEQLDHLVQMRRLVTRRDGAGRLIAWLARVLDASVVLADPVGSPLYASSAEARQRVGALAEEIERLSAKGGVRAAASLDLGGCAALLHPVGEEVVRAVLVIVREAGFSDRRTDLVREAVDLLSLRLELEHAGRLQDVDGRLREVVLQLLMNGAVGPAQRVAKNLPPGLPEGAIRVYVVQCPPGGRERAATLCERVILRAREHAWLVRCPAYPNHLIVFTAAGGTLDATLPEAITHVPGCYVGGSDVTELNRTADAYRQAFDALQTARRVPERWALNQNPVRLAALLEAGPARAWAAAVLQPLLARADHSHLVETLRLWLDFRSRAARILGVHHGTVRDRVQRVERILGRDLQTTAARAELWLALQVLAHSPAVLATPGEPAGRTRPPSLEALLGNEITRRWAARLLEPLLGDRSKLETLRVWLDHNGQDRRAAETLGVHSNTVRWRLRRVEEALDRALEGPSRYEVYFALRIHGVR